MTPGVKRATKLDPGPSDFGLKAFLVYICCADGTEHRLSVHADFESSVRNYLSENYPGATFRIL